MNKEVIQRCLITQFDTRLSKLGLKPEAYKEQLKEFSLSLCLEDIDNKFLRPERFINLSELLGIHPRKLYDKYYSFVFSDYGEVLVQFRNVNNLSQKKLAKMLGISPVDLSQFERGLKYPTRSQYLKLNAAIKHT